MLLMLTAAWSCLYTTRLLIGKLIKDVIVFLLSAIAYRYERGQVFLIRSHHDCQKSQVGEGL